MPTPGKDEKEKDFIGRCIPIVLKEGTAKDNKQAAAICYSMWRESNGKKKKKSFSLDAHREHIRTAWYAEYRKPTPPGASPDDLWVKEIFDDKVIVETPEGLFAYSYTVDSDDDIAFSEPTKVQVQYLPVGINSNGKSLAIKTLREENGGVVVGGPLLLWGSAGKKDLQGEYFTPETELWLDTYKGAPALFHHGLDDTIGLAVIGHRVKTEVRDSGVWVEDWLNTSNDYWAFVEPLLAAEKLYYSPGSAPHLVKCAQDGRLLSFPVVEDTLTPIPAQHRLLPVEQVKAAYKAAGLDLPDMPEPDAADLQGPGEGDGGPSRLAVARAKAKAEATLLNIRILEGQ